MNKYEKNWWNKDFYLATFEATGQIDPQDPQECEKRLKLTMDAGYDLVEITWKDIERTKTILDGCQKLNIPVILEDPYVSDKMCRATRLRNRESVILALDTYKEYSCIVSLYLFDEPQMEALELCFELADELRNADSDKLPFFALVPSYGAYTYENGLYPKYIDEFVEKVKPEVLSFDYYCFWQHCINNSLIHNPLWQDLGIWRKKSIETNLPLWWYFQGINFGPDVPERDSHKVITITHWAIQMYSGLAYGAKQLSCYSSFGSIIDYDGNPTHLYDGAKAINNNIKAIGQILFKTNQLGIYHTGILEYEEDLYYLNHVENNPYFSNATDDIIISIFENVNENKNEKLVMVVNKEFKKPVDVKIDFINVQNIHVFDTENMQWKLHSKNEQFNYDLAAGMGILIKIKEK